MKIFIGLHEIANVLFTYSEGFRLQGHETHTIVRGKNVYYPDSQYNVVLNVDDSFLGPKRPDAGFLEKSRRRIKKQTLKACRFLDGLRRFLHALITCDVFIFVFASSFFNKYIDYPILKLFRKRVVSIFLGDDIRHWSAYEQEMRVLGMHKDLEPLIEVMKGYGNSLHAQIMKVRAAEKYADLIFSQPAMGQLQVRPYMRTNIPLDLSRYRFSVPAREVPLILHAPSSRQVKGTDCILAVVDAMKKDGLNFEFELIENMPNEQLLNLLAEADIVIDQLFSQTIATLALESMASGNVVLSRYNNDYSKIPPDCPVVNVSRTTLKEAMREVVCNLDLRKRLAHEGRVYVEKYHSHRIVAQQILNWLGNDEIESYDFTPTFFREHFISPPEGSEGA